MNLLANNLTSSLLAFGIGWPEIAIIMLVILLLFGGKKLPELAKGVAKGMKVFKHEMNEVKTQIKDAADSVTNDDDEKKSDEKSADNDNKK